MCGRYTVRLIQPIMDHFQVDFLAETTARFNVAPTQDVPVVRADSGGRRVGALMHWGFIPSWADDPAIGNRMINARSETVAEKPAFRTAFQRRRCLIPADGFYEWQKLDGGKRKQPFFIRMKDDRPFAFAGLWEHWRRDDQEIVSCTILTTSPNELMKPIHDRMPVIVPSDQYERWMDSKRAGKDVTDLLAPFPAHAMTAQPISTYVNSPRNDDARCVEGITSEST